VTIVDNGSTDSTASIVSRLCAELPGVRAVYLPEKGRGRALRAAWSTSHAEVVVYTDVDLSTSLDALLPLVAPLLSGHSDLAIGSRLAKGSRVVRGAKRELVSRTYNMILRAALRNGFTDAQCGFKAVRSDVVRKLLPLVDDESWFFDTELLVLAERSGLRIHEVPVDWVDDPDSRVRIAKTASDDLRGVVRLLLHPRRVADRQASYNLSRRIERAVEFTRVGILSTLAYAVLFILLRGAGNYGADAIALFVCAIANFAAHLLMSPDVDHRSQVALVLAALSGLFTSLLFTMGALLISSLTIGAGWLPSLIAVMLATAIAGVVRFAVFRSLVFKTNRLDRNDYGRRPNR
jgi:putative flippase GtrA